MLCAAFLLCLLLCLTGCQKTRTATSGVKPTPPPLPKLNDPRYRMAPPKVGKNPRRANPVTLRVSYIDLSPQTNLNHALDLTEPALDERKTNLLAHNGLRFSLLAFKDYEKFAAALGKPVDVTRKNLVLAYDGTPLQTTPSLNSKVTVQLHQIQRPPLFRKRHGRYRFLISVGKTTRQTVNLNIVPQHHAREASVKPRSVLERIWDGTVFDELAAKFTLANGQLLVITYTPPITLSQWRQKQLEKDIFAPEPGDSALEKNYPTLGKMLLQYNRYHKQTQIMLVIARQP